MTASVTTRPPASTAAAPWASCSSPTGRRAKVGGCEWGWGAHCSPLSASDPRCVLSACRKGSDLAQLAIAHSAHWLGVCIHGMGTGIILQHGDWDALLQAPCLAPLPWEACGEEEKGVRSSWRQWHGPCGARVSCPISLHPTASAGRAGCAGNPHLLWECEMHESLWGHCSATSHMGENTPRCCTSHQHLQPPAPARQSSPGCFPCTPNLPLSGLAGACAVSFGSSQNLTPAERKACPTAGCLSTC